MTIKPPGMWTNAEDTLLRRHVGKKSSPEYVAKLLNRLVSSVEIRARVLGKPFGGVS